MPDDVATLCEDCKSIVIDPSKIIETKGFNATGREYLNSAGRYEVGKVRFDQYPSFPALEASGDSGCELCISLRRRFLQDFEETPPKIKFYDPIWDDWNLLDDDDKAAEPEGAQKSEWDGELEVSAPLIVFQKVINRIVFHIGHKDHVISRSIAYDIQADKGIVIPNSLNSE